MALKPHQRFRQRAFLAYSRLTRGMTFGVRAMLLKDGHVALVREIGEEVGAVLTGPVELFGLYRNAHADPRDHVALFVCRSWERRGVLKIPNNEIAASELFPLDTLPVGTSQGTKARLREVLAGEAPAPDW